MGADGRARQHRRVAVALRHWRSALVLVATGSSAGCLADEGTLGAPCEVGSDCEDGLLCDLHDGGGSCQRIHEDAEEPVVHDCSVETRADAYSLGLRRGGTWAQVEFVEASPAPPSRGDNTWTLRVLDGDGVARDDLDIDVNPYMPDHTHGSTVRCEVEAGPVPGTYVLAPLNLFMPGLWDVTLNIHADEFGDDAVKFTFCIDP